MKQIDSFLENGDYIVGVPHEKKGMVRHRANDEIRIQIREKVWYVMLKKITVIVKCVYLCTMEYSSIIMISKWNFQSI